ncbi:MAG: hypothetical protein ACI8RD_014404, partial [Bacillariaceae sp.]|jgi:hypothetical protein
VKHDTTAILNAEQIKFIQRTTGKFIFYARAIDNTMLHALNDIATSTMERKHIISNKSVPELCSK